MVVNSPRFKLGDPGSLSLPPTFGNFVLNHSLSFKEWEIEDNKLEVSVNCQANSDVDCMDGYSTPVFRQPKHLDRLLSPRSVSELEEAATKLQKSYKSYRTRRNLADCAVIVEELWWRALDFHTLKRSSVSFFSNGKPEPAASRWARAGRRAAKVGKGLSKDEKAQKLALRHWLEAIDPRHRYGHNLHMYYEVWYNSASDQPFFYWLDVGDGKEINLDKCPRDKLQQQCIRYLGPNERENFEVVLRDGKLAYKKTGMLVNTTDGSKWIFVLSTSRKFYVGKKQKGKFQHSSFLAGGATTAAGRLIASDGILKAIWPYSGHYLPTKENFIEFKSFLKENNVDLTNVKIGTEYYEEEEDLSFARTDDRIMHHISEYSDRHDVAEVEITELDESATDSSKAECHETDDEEESSYARPADRIMHQVSEGNDSNDTLEHGRTELCGASSDSEKPSAHDVGDVEDLSYTMPEHRLIHGVSELSDRVDAAQFGRSEIDAAAAGNLSISGRRDIDVVDSGAPVTFEPSKPLSCRWTTGAGARIGFVRDYPQDLQAMALEQVCLSPRPSASSTPTGNKTAIPSPRPGPQWWCSPRIACMGIPSPRLSPKFGQMGFPTPIVSLKLPPLKRRELVA